MVPEGGDFSRRVSQEELRNFTQQLDTLLATEEHRVSLYAEDFHGGHTAFGEIFDMNAFTAAHRTLPQNTLLRVTNADNGKSVIVRVNDRGPYIPGRDLDLSLAAFTALAPRSQGVIQATFERLGDARLMNGCTERLAGRSLGEGRYQKRITREVRFHRGVPHVFPLGETLVLSANRPFVVRRVRYPDGTVERIEDWVLEKEKFTFRPSLVGTYIFRMGTPYRRSREMRMEVVACQVDIPSPL
ncbi:septal ring lytic transglycosylase RlpA family protein [Candidatus Peregrinibacteria bacterium]|nr:septal ring lytic transglycosylase RlpA family protein [Candidatus Peregrinibacteria bacterium]